MLADTFLFSTSHFLLCSLEKIQSPSASQYKRVFLRSRSLLRKRPMRNSLTNHEIKVWWKWSSTFFQSTLHCASLHRRELKNYSFRDILIFTCIHMIKFSVEQNTKKMTRHRLWFIINYYRTPSLSPPTYSNRPWLKETTAHWRERIYDEMNHEEEQQVRDRWRVKNSVKTKSR